VSLFRKTILIGAAAIVLAASPPLQAQIQAGLEAQEQEDAPVIVRDPNFAPVMATFSGTNASSYAPSPSLDINGYGTIEFWVAVKWRQNPGYDPAIMAYYGPTGARFAIYVTGDAKALGVQAGPHFDKVAFDFSDGEMHHVALTTLGDTISVMIDGEVQSEALNFGFGAFAPTAFSIGAAGNVSPFIGQIGQVRIWNEPIDPDVLADFAWKALGAEAPNLHPNIDALVGVSAFANPETSGFIFAGEPEDAELMAADAVANNAGVPAR
jgi:hypothetical protein